MSELTWRKLVTRFNKMHPDSPKKKYKRVYNWIYIYCPKAVKARPAKDGMPAVKAQAKYYPFVHEKEMERFIDKAIKKAASEMK